MHNKIIGPPAVIEALDEYLLNDVRAGDKTILVGDYNLPNIEWANYSSVNADENVECLLAVAFNHNRAQVVLEPTRIQGNCKNILDPVFLSNSIASCDYEVEVVRGISDYSGVYITLSTSGFPKTCEVTNILDFNSADDSGVLHELVFRFGQFNANLFGNTFSTEQLWQTLKRIARECITNFVPVKYKNLTHEPRG